MALKQLQNIKGIYLSRHDDIVLDFYVPCLKNSKLYRRAAGYFSSSILTHIAKGLSSYLESNNKIRLLISPEISKEDFEVIKAANFSNSSIDNYINSKLNLGTSIDETSRYSLLYHLIKNNILEIKFAIVKNYSDYAIYHEKIGIFTDEFDNSIVFVGSSNETEYAIKKNYESFNTFKSWEQSSDNNYCEFYINHFDKLWDGVDEEILTLNISQAIEKQVVRFSHVNPGIYDFGRGINVPVKPAITLKERLPELKTDIKLKDHQKEAIENFVNNSYKGTFSMATGSGKTFTAAGAIVRTFKDFNRLFVVVVVPLLHLVDQWQDELEKFNIDSLKIFGLKSSWENKLRKKVELFNQKLIKFSLIIVTNKTFATKQFQDSISPILANTLIIADEAHNLGSESLFRVLSDKIPYRIALSATIHRHNDNEGTNKLLSYFGKEIINYDLSKAIRDGVLTNYKYYPILVNLTYDELEEYKDISSQISQLYARLKGKFNDNLKVKSLLIRRSKIIAGAKNKIEALFEIIKEKYTSENNLLIYCGALTYGENDNYEYGDDIRQIDLVQKYLGLNLKMKVSKFTAEEPKSERAKLIDQYKNNQLQALIAIRCLDEGVDIPAIKTAFIIASSTNPKQYIQRRGRLLRKFDNKAFSVIFDFVVSTRSIKELNYLNEKEIEIESRLVISELERVREFSRLALNTSDSNEIINLLKQAYKLNTIKINKGDFYDTN